MRAPAPDPWPAIEELAGMLNDLAGQVLAHTKRLQRITLAQPGRHGRLGRGPCRRSADLGRAAGGGAGSHAQVGPPERWGNIPPLRAELLGMKIADVRRLKLPQGSFELLYWHAALARSSTGRRRTPIGGNRTSRINACWESGPDAHIPGGRG